MVDAFARKQEELSAKQKAPIARRAIGEEYNVLRYTTMTRAIAATRQLMSFCDAIKITALEKERGGK
jgi:hypothetical protein